MSKFIFSILFLLCLTVEDIQGQNNSDELEGNNFLNRTTDEPNPKMKCSKCDYMNKKGKCLSGEGICIPSSSQVCMTKKVYQDGKFEYISQGCEKFCSSMTFIDNRKLVQFECCEDKAPCNIP